MKGFRSKALNEELKEEKEKTITEFSDKELEEFTESNVFEKH